MIKPGIHYGLTMDEYLAIPAVSAGVIEQILDRCPAAAWYCSPWNPNRPRNDTEATDHGSIAHEIFLEDSRARLQVIDPKDHPNATKGKDGSYGIPDGWTNKAMRDARSAARAANLIPVLPSDVAEIEAMVGAAERFVESLQDGEPAVWQMFQPECGHSEVTMVWLEGETLCKLRADRIAKDFAIICDYKSTKLSVEPSRWARTSLDYLGAAWYRRGCRAITGVDPAYLFLCGELVPPYLHSLIGLLPSDLALGDEKIGAGLRMWQECERAGRWPGYPARTCFAEIPVYHRLAWDERNGVGEDGLPATNAEIWRKQA